MELELSDPMGKKEMGELLNVKRRTVHVWHDRAQLPIPDWPSVNGQPAWSKRTILLWALKTGRSDRMSEEAQKEAKKLLASVLP